MLIIKFLAISTYSVLLVAIKRVSAASASLLIIGVPSAKYKALFFSINYRKQAAAMRLVLPHS